jgi:NADH dehydrogenase FAD-containing subunit
MTVVLVFALTFFTITMNEGILGHSFLYGVVVAFLLNGAGRWQRPVATDKPSHIVILGATFTGIHGAMRLERLLRPYTNVKLTLVKEENYFQFWPLVPEVIGGSIQPGNVVNPIRRICPQTEYLRGRIATIDPAGHTVGVVRPDGSDHEVAFDQLIVAMEMSPKFSRIPGLQEHAYPVAKVADALFLRDRILSQLERVETITDPDLRRRELCFIVVGGGQRGCAIASEIMELLNSALIFYPNIDPAEPRVVILEREAQIIPNIRGPIGSAVNKRLTKLGVDIRTNCRVQAVSGEGVTFEDGNAIQGRTIIGAIWSRPTVVGELPGALPGARIPVDKFLHLPGSEDVFVAGACASFDAERAFSALRETRMGTRAAENAWAQSQDYAQRPWRDRDQAVILTALGRHGSAIQLFGMVLGGLPVWFLSRFVCLFTLPGLERNLSILIDWILDLVFRNDIVDLASHGDALMHRGDYEAGKDIVRKGEIGQCLYLILSGDAELTRDENGMATTVKKLSQGDWFGQSAVVDETAEPGTVRATTALKTLVLPKHQIHY